MIPTDLDVREYPLLASVCAVEDSPESEQAWDARLGKYGFELGMKGEPEAFQGELERLLAEARIKATAEAFARAADLIPGGDEVSFALRDTIRAEAVKEENTIDAKRAANVRRQVLAEVLKQFGESSEEDFKDWLYFEADKAGVT